MKSVHNKSILNPVSGQTDGHRACWNLQCHISLGTGCAGHYVIAGVNTCSSLVTRTDGQGVLKLVVLH